MEKIDRRQQILTAACRVAVRTGIHAFRIRDIADEAGVSQALISYYFPSRDELVARTFVFADERNALYLGEQMKGAKNGAERLSRRLLSNLDADREVQEAWTIWLQAWSHAALESGLGERVRERQVLWTETLTQIIRGGQSDGSISAEVDADQAGLRLAILLDGLWASLLNRVVTRTAARQVLKDTIDLTLKVPLTT